MPPFKYILSCSFDPLFNSGTVCGNPWVCAPPQRYRTMLCTTDLYCVPWCTMGTSVQFGSAQRSFYVHWGRRVTQSSGHRVTWGSWACHDPVTPSDPVTSAAWTPGDPTTPTPLMKIVTLYYCSDCIGAQYNFVSLAGPLTGISAAPKAMPGDAI